MQTKIIEAASPFNWGKFMLMRFTTEWELKSRLHPEENFLRSMGWGPAHLWVLDLQTGEGAFFLPGGIAPADLNKHQIWVCPLFEPFLSWLYQQDLKDIEALPNVVSLPKAPPAMYGYRRTGVKP